jgi:GNAT superfamily N-acetyltransferase
MKYKLGTAIDKTGETVTMWHSDYLSQQREVGALVMEALQYLLERKWGRAPFGAFNNNHNVIWAENSEGKPMAGVVYEYHQFVKQGFIMIIFTSESYRGRGLYSIVQRFFEDEIIKNGGTSIASEAHVANEVRLRAGAKEGMLPEYHRLYKDLTPVLAERKKQMEKESNKSWEQLNREQWNAQTGRSNL